MERISTGIDMLDTKLSGGYPKDKVILVTGVSGSGKTILALHFLHNACKAGKKCVLVATQELPEDIIGQANVLGLELLEYYKTGKFSIVRAFQNRSEKVQTSKFGFTPEGLEIELPSLIDYIPQGTDVFVVDAIGVFTLRLSLQDFRDQFDALNFLLTKKEGCTSMLIMDEAAFNQSQRLAEYSSYGSIRLLLKENQQIGTIERYLTISKMKRTNIKIELLPFEITPTGIKFP